VVEEPNAESIFTKLAAYVPLDYKETPWLLVSQWAAARTMIVDRTKLATSSAKHVDQYVCPTHVHKMPLVEESITNLIALVILA
jgi:hypothetical protein